jgi:hypothetical protein
MRPFERRSKTDRADDGGVAASAQTPATRSIIERPPAPSNRQGGCRGALIVGDGGHPLPGSTVGQFPGSAWLTNRLTLQGCLSNDSPAGLGDGTHRSGGRPLPDLLEPDLGLLVHPPGKCVPPLSV